MHAARHRSQMFAWRAAGSLRSVRSARLLPLLHRALSSRTPSKPTDVLRPRAEQGEWVSDAPGILSARARDELNERMNQLNADGRGQMAILLLEDIRSSRSLPGVGAYGRFT